MFPNWTSDTQPRNLRVIDCQQRAIIPQPEGAPYIALSYVWAKSRPIRWNSIRLRLLVKMKYQQVMGVFRTQIHIIRCLKLILDSMKVTLELGYRYLCIRMVVLALELVGYDV